jgi:A/G-specific adenine glycosylase
MYDSLVSWFIANQRPLPWRQTYDPYHVWVSEVMLQQTQVETALPYYERFLAEFPTLKHLAAADETQVLGLWAGLGYYGRARNLLKAAREIASVHGGVMPTDYDALLALPGVGAYMAGAVMSIAYNEPFPIVDGNVRRVLSRINGWTDEDVKRLWNAAAEVVRQAEPRMVNQALMELGAKICSFRAPRCLVCPVQSSCVAFKTGMQTEIPTVRKRPDTIHVQIFAIVHQKRGKYLMKHANGFWEFPMFNEPPTGAFTEIGNCRHTITHHRLTVRVYTGAVQDKAEFEWQTPNAVPISSLTKKILSTSQKARM